MTDVPGSDSAGSIETYGRHRNAVESLAAYVRGKPNKFVRLLRAKVNLIEMNLSTRLTRRRRQKTRPRSLMATLRGQSGAIDLASIMTGVLVIGIIGGTIAATVFAVVPWAQDNAARADLGQVRLAEGVYAASHAGGYADLATIQGPSSAAGGGGAPGQPGASISAAGAPLLPSDPTRQLKINANANGFVAAEISQTGRTFYVTSMNKTVSSTQPAVMPAGLSAPSFAVAPPVTPIVASGPAIYGFAQPMGSPMAGLTLNNASATPATIQYVTGDANCSLSSVINGDVILARGNASLNGSCTLNGNLSASGYVTVNKSSVAGNVVAGSSTYPAVNIYNSSSVNGNLTAAGPVIVAGGVAGNVVAGPATGTTNVSGTIAGSLTTAGTVALSGTVKKGVRQNISGILAPVLPVVKAWTDFSYTASDWTGAGFAQLTVTDCSTSGVQSAVTSALGSTSPVVVNALACSSGVDFSQLQSSMKLHSDLAVIAKSFKLGGNAFDSTDSTVKRLWLVSPDAGTSANHTPDCNGTFALGAGVQTSSWVNGMIYTPCQIANTATSWRGQIYSAGMTTPNAFTLTYAPVGLPGVNLG